MRSAGDLIGLYFEAILEGIQQRPALATESNGNYTVSSSKNSSSSSSSSSSRNNSSSNVAISGLSGPHSSTPGPVPGPLPAPAPAPTPTPTPVLCVLPPIEWLPGDPKKAAFEVLVRCSPFGAWKHHQQVLGESYLNT